MQMSGQDLAQPLGPLPPMKIHCGQMVEGALKAALEAENAPASSLPAIAPPSQSGTLVDSLSAAGKQAGKIKIILQS